MELIQSNSCLFQIALDGPYVTILCAKSFTPDFVAKVKETTTEGDGTYQDFDYDQKSYSIQLDGVLVIQDNVTPTILDLFDYHRNMTEVPFRILYFGANGNVKAIKGVAIVENVSLPASAGLLAEGSVKLQGKGAYEVFDVVPDYVNLRIHMHNNNPANALLKFRLIDATGQVIFQTDTLPEAVAGDLVNPFDITVPVLKGTWYYWFQMTSNLVGNTFNLDAPPTKTSNFNSGSYAEGSFPTQAYDFTSDRTVEFILGINNPPPGCVAPIVQSGLSNNSATQYTFFSGTINVSGTGPFNFTNVTKPSWLNIQDLGSGVILLSGTPDVSGDNQPVSFDINNACGTDSFSGDIDVAPLASPIAVNWEYTEASGSSCGFRLWVNGVLVVTTDVPASGVVYVNSFDVIEAFVVGLAVAVKHLDVQDVGVGELYNNTAGGGTVSFSWPAVGLHNYEVNAEGVS
jgi:hypothetical protein